MDELWRGVYIGNVTVRFPLYFKNRTSKQRISVGVNSLLIDKIGVSGEIFGENIMTIKDGDLSGWDYSIDGESNLKIQDTIIVSENLFGNVSSPLNVEYGYTKENDTMESGAITTGRWA
jgi:hypothetical protein